MVELISGWFIVDAHIRDCKLGEKVKGKLTVGGAMYLNSLRLHSTTRIGTIAAQQHSVAAIKCGQIEPKL